MLVHYEGAKDERNASIQTLCWHSGLFDKCVLSLQKNAQGCSKHPKHNTLTKETIKHRSLRGVRKAPQI